MLRKGLGAKSDDEKSANLDKEMGQHKGLRQTGEGKTDGPTLMLKGR